MLKSKLYYFMKSPWLKEIKSKRISQTLTSNTFTEIAIIGAGIAGISTAYYLLKNMKCEVNLYEANKAAHGATGHNAGQVVDYFERPFSDIVREYGGRKAAEAQEAIYSAWSLLDQILSDTKIKINYDKFIGYAGLSHESQLLKHLENKRLKSKYKISQEKIYISDEFSLSNEIIDKYKSQINICSQKEIQKKLQTIDKKYIALLASKKGCLNSALFCEKLINYLIKKYPDRFKLYENTEIKKLTLSENQATLITQNNVIYADKAILCTNGFENIEIENLSGQNIDKSFHANLFGIKGYMKGYYQKTREKPTAISYYDDPKVSKYFYYTLRKSPKGNGRKLICLGGPEKIMGERIKYSHKEPFPKYANMEFDKFINSTYSQEKVQMLKPAFSWHGLMGYTRSRIRLIGFEPKNRNLLYNLGCNGVGILPSIFGAYRISQLLQNKKVKKMIFDPE